MRALNFAICLIIAVFTNACAWAENEKNIKSPPQSDPSAYTIAPGDVLEVSVWKEENLNREVLVAPDGRISFPLAGIIKAADKSVTEIHQEIVKRLEDYIADPVVNVAIVNNQGNSVFVIGKVTKPGEYIVKRNIDVLQALSLAGGITPFADGDDIKVLRRLGSGIKVYSFDYGDVIKGKRLEQNILLKAGDTVAVP